MPNLKKRKKVNLDLRYKYLKYKTKNYECYYNANCPYLFENGLNKDPAIMFWAKVFDYEISYDTYETVMANFKYYNGTLIGFNPIRIDRYGERKTGIIKYKTNYDDNIDEIYVINPEYKKAITTLLFNRKLKKELKVKEVQPKKKINKI